MNGRFDFLLDWKSLLISLLVKNGLREHNVLSKCSSNFNFFWLSLLIESHFCLLFFFLFFHLLNLLLFVPKMNYILLTNLHFKEQIFLIFFYICNWFGQIFFFFLHWWNLKFILRNSLLCDSAVLFPLMTLLLIIIFLISHSLNGFFK